MQIRSKRVCDMIKTQSGLWYGPFKFDVAKVVLWRYSVKGIIQKIHKIHRNTTVMEPFLSKVAGLKSTALHKNDFLEVFFFQIFEIFSEAATEDET